MSIMERASSFSLATYAYLPEMKTFAAPSSAVAVPPWGDSVSKIAPTSIGFVGSDMSMIERASSALPATYIYLPEMKTPRAPSSPVAEPPDSVSTIEPTSRNEVTVDVALGSRLTDWRKEPLIKVSRSEGERWVQL